MAPIDDYKRHAAAQLQLYRAQLLDGRSTGFLRAAAYRAYQIMIAQLQTPKYVLAYDVLPPEPKFGMRGAARWQLECQNKAGVELDPGSSSDSDTWLKKMQEYIDFRDQLLVNIPTQTRYTADKFNGIGYLRTPSPELPKVMNLVAAELVRWSTSQPFDAAFAAKPASQGYIDFLAERPDLIAMFRMAQALPGDFERFDIPVEVPTAIQSVELVIGLIPAVGNVVAVYEAYTGQNLFGYRLSDAERAIIAATVLLPIAGRFFKAGRVAYTEARLVRLYGRDASAWSRTILTGERIAGNPGALQKVIKAEEALRLTGKVDAALLQDAAKALLVLKGNAAASKPVEQAVIDLFRSISAEFPVLQSLDELALRRILQKGPNLSHIKGQMVEELLESQVVPWLSSRTGGFAFGLEVPAGKQLEFIPGHMIRDLNSRQITDGILGYRDKGKLTILAVFEAKAGPKAARELSVARDTVSSLTDAEKAELAGAIEDEFLDGLDEARQAGLPFTKTRDQIAKEYLQKERGGQLGRDIERLAPNAGGGPTQIFVGRERIPVDFSPTKTKFFGVIPQGLKASLVQQIRAELSAEKIAYEIVAVPMTAKDVDAAAAKLVPLADQVLKGTAK